MAVDIAGTFGLMGDILKWGWPIILIGIMWATKVRLSKFPLDVVIIEKRDDNLIKTNDRAGRYKDPYTGMIGYRLLKAKDNIPVVNYDYVMHNVVNTTNIFDKILKMLRPDIGTVFFFRYGSKQYKPLKIIQAKGINTKLEEIKGKDGNSKLINVYQQFDPRNKLGALDFEIVDWDNMNFIVSENAISLDRRKKKSDWMKTIAIPAMIIAGAVLVSIVMMKFSMDHSGTLSSSSGVVTPVVNAPATVPDIPGISNILPS